MTFDFGAFVSALPFILVAILIIAVLFIALKSAWQIAEPNEALIIAGFGGKSKDNEMGFRICTGSGALVIPGLQRSRRLWLGMREAELSSDCVTTQGVPVSVRGVCMYKVGDGPASIANAARRFLGQSDDVINANIRNILDGHLRSIIGGVTMEQLVRDRDALIGETRKAAADEMANLGLVIDSLQIPDLDDPQGYIKSMAAPHIAQVKRDARVAEAERDRDATIAEQEAVALKSASVRDTQVKVAQFEAEAAAAQAKAAQEGPLADARAKQAVSKETTSLLDIQSAQREQQLRIDVVKPADAAAYQVRVAAEAARDASIAAATGQAETMKLNAAASAEAARVQGQGQGDAAKAIGDGQAAAIQAKGIAEGKAIEAKVLAEAAGIKARGEAFADNAEANIAQTLAEKMPEIVASAAAPFGQIKDLVVFNGAEGMQNLITTAVGMAGTLLPKLRNAIAAIKQGADGPPA